MNSLSTVWRGDYSTRKAEQSFLVFNNLEIERERGTEGKMAVRGNSLMPFSIQAILNKKDESKHLPELDVCFSKTACWKIFGEMNGGARRAAGELREPLPAETKSYDSDSGLSDDTERKDPAACKLEKDGGAASDVPDESLQEETDLECAAAENAKSDSEPSHATGKDRFHAIYVLKYHLNIINHSNKF